MITLSGRVIDGSVVFDTPPPECIEGKRVEIEVIEEDEPQFGIPDRDWPTTPEGIQQLITEMMQEEPVEWTDAEWSNWEKERKERKEIEIPAWTERAKRIEEIFS